MDTVPSSAKAFDMSEINSLNNGRFSNRAARFYWADEEPTPMRAYSIQQIAKSSTDSHFEESPLVIAAISAGVIGVAIIIIILVGIWIRSRLFTEVERRASENPNNVSVRSSMSTLDEDAYAVCMEMDGTVLGSMHNAVNNFYANDATTIDMEPSEDSSTSKVPEGITVDPCELPSTKESEEMTNDITDEANVKTIDSLSSTVESITN